MMMDDGKVSLSLLSLITRLGILALWTSSISMVICCITAASKPVAKSRSSHLLPYNTSLDNMISHSDSGQDHEFQCDKFTTEMLRLLAEVHCIFAEVSDMYDCKYLF